MRVGRRVKSVGCSHGEVEDLEALVNPVPGLDAELAPLQDGLGGRHEVSLSGGALHPQVSGQLEHSQHHLGEEVQGTGGG